MRYHPPAGHDFPYVPAAAPTRVHRRRDLYATPSWINPSGAARPPADASSSMLSSAGLQSRKLSPTLHGAGCDPGEDARRLAPSHPAASRSWAAVDGEGVACMDLRNEHAGAGARCPVVQSARGLSTQDNGTPCGRVVDGAASWGGMARTRHRRLKYIARRWTRRYSIHRQQHITGCEAARSSMAARARGSRTRALCRSWSLNRVLAR